MQKKPFTPAAAFSEGVRPAIPLFPVESGQVGAIGYDEPSQTLAVQFKRGARAIYHYPGVTRETFEAFKGAESIGTYFGAHIAALPFEKFPAEDADSLPAA